MALDLTGPRTAAESVLFGTGADQCEIIRRSIDPTTFNAGAYDVPAPSLVYTGPCSAKATGTSFASQRAQQGAVDATQERWQVTLPMLTSAANPPRAGDVIVMTTARDEAIDAARFVIRDVTGGTNSVLRRCVCDRWRLGGGDDWAAPNAS